MVKDYILSNITCSMPETWIERRAVALAILAELDQLDHLYYRKDESYWHAYGPAVQPVENKGAKNGKIEIFSNYIRERKILLM